MLLLEKAMLLNTNAQKRTRLGKRSEQMFHNNCFTLANDNNLRRSISGAYFIFKKRENEMDTGQKIQRFVLKNIFDVPKFN